MEKTDENTGEDGLIERITPPAPKPMQKKAAKPFEDEVKAAKREIINLAEIREKLDRFEQEQNEKDEEIARLREELATAKESVESQYMFPKIQVLPFKVIAKITNDDPVLFRSSFLDDPDAFVWGYIHDYYSEISTLGHSLQVMGLNADDTNYEDSMNKLAAYTKKHHECDYTDEFPKDHDAMVPELEKFLGMVKKLSFVRLYLVQRSIAKDSLFAYWLHFRLGDSAKIIHPDVAHRMDKKSEPDEEEPLEDASEDKDDYSGLMDDKQKEKPKEEPKKKGILEQAAAFISRPPVEPKGKPEAGQEGDEDEEEGNEDAEEKEG